MPRIKYYDDIKIIKKPIKKRLNNFLKFLLIVLFFMLTIFSSVKFSKVLSVGQIGGYLAYGGSDIKIKSSQLFAVTLGKYESFDELVNLTHLNLNHLELELWSLFSSSPFFHGLILRIREATLQISLSFRDSWTATRFPFSQEKVHSRNKALQTRVRKEL